MTTAVKSIAGKAGFQRTLQRHWRGDRLAYIHWLAAYGAWRAAYGISNTWYIKFKHPGPHPAWSPEESAPCPGWCGRHGIPARDCICHWTPF